MDITLRNHKRAGVGINVQGGGGVGEALTCPPRDGHGADARRDAERGFGRRDFIRAPGRRRLRGVPDGIERSIGTSRRPGEYRALF
jgi:hypothetical protein